VAKYHRCVSLLYRSYECIGLSPPVFGGPSLALSVVGSANPPATVAQQTVTRTLALRVYQTQGLAVDVSNAWVGLYANKHTPLDQYTAFAWVLHGEPDPNSDMFSAGSPSLSSPSQTTFYQARIVIFTAPRCGTWVLRVFPFRTYSPVSVLEAVLAGENSLVMRVDPVDPARLHVSATVTTIDPSGGRSVYIWVGFRNEQRPNYYRRFQYISDLGTTEVTFKTPVHAGIYEARLYCTGQPAAGDNDSSSNSVLVRSAPLELADRPDSRFGLF